MPTIIEIDSDEDDIQPIPAINTSHRKQENKGGDE